MTEPITRKELVKYLRQEVGTLKALAIMRSVESRLREMRKTEGDREMLQSEFLTIVDEELEKVRIKEDIA